MIFRNSRDAGISSFECIVDDSESLFGIFEKISRALGPNESLKITNVVFKHSGVILDVNRAVLKLIGDQNATIDCLINDAPHLFVILQVYRNCKDQFYRQVRVERNIDPIRLREYLSDLFAMEIIGLFKIDDAGLLTTTGNLDDEYVVIVERKQCEFIINNVREEGESRTVECFNDCNVAVLKQMIALEYGYDINNFLLFLGDHWLEEGNPIYLYQVADGAGVRYCHFEEIGSVDKIKNSKVAGSNSTIYNAKIIATGEMITIKRYHCSGASYKYMIRELVTLTKIGHNQRLVQFKALYRDKNALYIGLEHMAGGSIGTYIKDRKPLDESLIRKWSEQILQGLRILHENRITHRGLKPSNILLDGNNDIKISGFNLSRYQMGATPTAMSKGSVQSKPGDYNYMAPEVIKGDKSGWKVDIWSFGAVLVEIVTGEPPFHEMYMVDAFEIINETGTIDYKSDKISTELRNFISRCLKSDPHERPRVSELLQDPFLVQHVAKT